MVHYLEPPKKRGTAEEIRAYQADYRKLKADKLRKLKADWYLRVGKQRRRQREQASPQR